jgi:hypothetical protein
MECSRSRRFHDDPFAMIRERAFAPRRLPNAHEGQVIQVADRAAGAGRVEPHAEQVSAGAHFAAFDIEVVVP